MFSATDIINFLACRHLSVLEQDAAAGRREKPFSRDPSQELLRELGIRHEQNYLHKLDAGKSLNVVQIPAALSWQDAVAETKLARSARANAILQLCFYSEVLAKTQGVVPERMHVVLGDSKVESFAVACYIAYFRKVRNDFLRAGPAPTGTYPEPVELCRVCTWFSVCDKQRHTDDHLSLVAGITRNQRKQLVARNIQTLEALGTLKLPVLPKIDRIGEAALVRIHGQAHLQRNGRNEGKMIYEILEPIEEEKGFAALPTPSPGDVFLDFE